MSNRFEEINSYLVYLRDVYKENPNIPITPRSIYGTLASYGVDVGNDLSLDEFHLEWINYFSNVDNIDVFVSPTWRCFCQFKNVKPSAKEKNRLKLYLSVDKEHINQAAKEIFKFLADNNIEHISKIGKKVRSDSIVIRLQNIEDLPKIKEFVKSCESVSKGKQRTNPFLYRDDVFAYALDDYLSYNSVVSTYLSEYFNVRKNENKLDSVSYSDFYQFLYSKYNLVFIEGNNLDKYMEDYNFNNDYHPMGFHARFLNYYQITYLLLNSLNPNFSLEQLINLYDEYNDENKLNAQLEGVNNFLYNNRTINALHSNEAELITDEYIVKKCVALMSKKYGTNQARINFNHYINKNDLKYITREGGMRNQFEKRLSPDKVLEILNGIIDNNNFIAFAEKTLIEFDNKEILKNAALATMKKYQELSNSGASQLWHALNLGLGGDYSGFTNQDLARAKLKDNILTSEFKKTIISTLGLDERFDYNPTYLIHQYVEYISSCYNNTICIVGGNSL